MNYYDEGQPRFNCALSQPQRMDVPWYYSSPPNKTRPAGSDQLEAYEDPKPSNYIKRVQWKAQRNRYNPKENSLKHIPDLKLLSDALMRDGKRDEAALIYHKMGIIYENNVDYQNSIKSYFKFLTIATSQQNTRLQALAHNCLGVAHFKAGEYDASVQHHSKHAALCQNDAAALFIAHTNLGLGFEKMNVIEHAAVHHQHAVELSHHLQSKQGKAVAVGNLGLCELLYGSPQTAEACLKFHLNNLPHINESSVLEAGEDVQVMKASLPPPSPYSPGRSRNLKSLRPDSAKNFTSESNLNKKSGQVTISPQRTPLLSRAGGHVLETNVPSSPAVESPKRDNGIHYNMTPRKTYDVSPPRVHSELNALDKLTTLAFTEGKLQSANACMTRALALSKTIADSEAGGDMKNTIKVKKGVVAGALCFDAYKERLLQDAVASAQGYSHPSSSEKKVIRF